MRLFKDEGRGVITGRKKSNIHAPISSTQRLAGTKIEPIVKYKKKERTKLHAIASVCSSESAHSFPVVAMVIKNSQGGN